MIVAFDSELDAAIRSALVETVSNLVQQILSDHKTIELTWSIDVRGTWYKIRASKQVIGNMQYNLTVQVTA